MPNMKEMVDDFLAQKRIAVVGVSRGTESPANGIYKKLRDTGYTVYPINPNAQTLEGDPAYPDVKSTPYKPDGVVIVTRPEETDKVVRDCAEAGIQRVWIHCSLVGHGSSASETAVQFCHENNITVIPSGCPFMYCKPVDPFHAGMRWFMRVTGKLPQ
jgi:hypothetical protein